MALIRIICSRKFIWQLEQRMKATSGENVLLRLSLENADYVSSINGNREWSKPEDFWDIQLDVCDKRSLDDSVAF
jgi:hypothetical protein